MSDRVHGTFVSQKINKIRWKPEDLIPSDLFIAGSWDNEPNQVVLWMYPECEDGSDGDPRQLKAYPHRGDVTELKFINNNQFVVSSSLGSISLFQVNVDRMNTSDLKLVTSWEKLHYFGHCGSSPCTGMSCFEDDIATVGEDGRLVLLTARQNKPVRVIDSADSCSLHCVCFLKHYEVLTGNLRGQMKIWDLKSKADKPSSTFMLSGDQVGASCVAHHPTQRHLVLAGGEDGSLTVWDLRHNTFPVTLLSAHSDSVSELQFHPDRPEHLFTCSLSGEIWHWNTSNMSQSGRPPSNPDVSIEDNPWLSDAAKQRLQVVSLMTPLHKPINSLDVNKTRVLCGCDNEAIYVFNSVAL